MKTTLDVQTNAAIGERGLINIFTPDDSGPHPFVLIVHGGGWHTGNHTSMQWIAERMVSYGFGAVCCTYRLVDTAIYPAAYDDLIALMKWLRTHGASHGLDADRCALLGGSAGGHLVCLLGCRAPQDETIATIRAVVGYCPVADMRKQFESDPGNDIAVALNFMGGTPDEVPEAYTSSSPTDHVHSDVPPTMLIHGDEDQLVWLEPTVVFAEKLRTAGVETHLHIAKGYGHSMAVDRQAPRVELLFEDEVRAFLDETLR